MGKRVGRGVIGRAVRVSGRSGVFVVRDVPRAATPYYLVTREWRSVVSVRAPRRVLKFVRHNYESK